MAVTEIAGAVKVALEIIKSHIDDPKRRLRAIQDYRDELKKYIEQVRDAKDMSEVDNIISDFIAALHKL